jgi:UDP-glucose 4-epimerase
MNVLVTGGAGFIGSHLCEILLTRGCKVSVIDDLSTGRYENIEHLEKNGNFELIIDTILNKSLIETLVKSADTVFHLASAVGVRLILEQPVKTIETIVEGTSVVLSQARRYRRKVILTSTSEVYGKGSKVPFSEDDDTVLGPTTTRRWAYAAAKTIDEFLALAHWYETRLPVTCARLFNTVGPRQTGQYGMVIPRFIEAALQEKNITVYGDGEQTRSFCHVKDVVTALVNLSSSPNALGRVVNIGNNQEITINNLAARVKELSGSASDIVHIPYESAYEEGFEDMKRRVPDLTLARELIDFRPKHSLDDILLDVIEEHRNRAKQKEAGLAARPDRAGLQNLMRSSGDRRAISRAS